VSPLIRFEKKFLQNWACRVSKEAEFQNCAEVLSLAKGKTFFYRKSEFLGTWKILQKIIFLKKNLEARVLHIF
jgi:hypothetical protein